MMHDGIVHRPSPTVSFQKINAGKKKKKEEREFCFVELLLVAIVQWNESL